MTKMTIISAITASLITSAVAFDTNTTGEILNFSGQKATFTETASASKSLKIGTNKGDALVFQAFNQKDGFGTEIVIRNNSNVGTVVKVALHESKESKEILDFNVYLSANDVTRFTIKDNKVTSTDDSMLVSGGESPLFASIGQPFAYPFEAESGYVMAYAMAQTSNKEHGEDAKMALIKEYRNGLDFYRENWDEYSNMQEGVYVNETTDSKGNPTSVTVAPYLEVDGKSGIDLHGAENDTLSGTTRIFNSEMVERDMIINAQGLLNFTENGKIMLWSPGEVAAIVDRNIIVKEVEDGPGTTGSNKPEPTKPPLEPEVIYSLDGILADTVKLAKYNAYYTYANEGENSDVDNELIITQVFKRQLVQLGNKSFWAEMDCADREGKGYGFRTYRTVWDESENTTNTETDIPEVSPGNSLEILGYCNELATIVSPEKETEFAEKNGYIKYQFGINGIPGVISQMKATKVGESYKTNWIETVVGGR